GARHGGQRGGRGRPDHPHLRDAQPAQARPASRGGRAQPLTPTLRRRRSAPPPPPWPAPAQTALRPARRIVAMTIAVSREPGARREVSPLELFFDLVYVFAVGQLSHHLVAHVDLRTGTETVITALAVFYAWYMVAWGANWLDPD